MAETDAISFLEWVRIVEVPVMMALVAALGKHIWADTRQASLTASAIAKVEADLRAAEATARAELAEYRLTAAKEGNADTGALKAQVSALHLELSSQYVRTRDMRDYMDGVEAKLLDGLRELKVDMNSRIAELLASFKDRK